MTQQQQQQQHHHHHASIREDYFSTRKLMLNWKLLLLRVLINGSAIAITAFLLPGIIIDTSNLIINLLILGIAFGLLNAFIKPLIQVLTISLLFITYGLVVIIINTIMLFLLDFLVADIMHVDNIFAGIMGGIVISLLSLVLDNIFGLSPPIVDDETFEKMATKMPSQGMGFVHREQEVEMDEDPFVMPRPVTDVTEAEAEVQEAMEGVDDLELTAVIDDLPEVEIVETIAPEEPPEVQDEVAEETIEEAEVETASSASSGQAVIPPDESSTPEETTKEGDQL